MYMYVLSQIAFILAYLGYGASYVLKDRPKLLACNFISSILFVIAYICLDAKSAMYINIVSIVRQGLLLIQEKNQNQKMYVYVFFFNIISTIIVGVLTYENIYSALPALATLIFVYSSWQKSISMYRLWGIVIEINWLIYGLYLRSIVSIVMETIILISVIVNFIKINKEECETKVG